MLKVLIGVAVGVVLTIMYIITLALCKVSSMYDRVREEEEIRNDINKMLRKMNKNNENESD